MFVLRLFSRRWLLTTLLVLAAAAVMVRLGIWQLDRLEQRRAFNARVMSQVDEETLTLSEATFDMDLYDMEYRRVQVRGVYDFSEEVALRNQVWQDRPGVSLLTPLKVAGTEKAVVVERGWIPLEDADPSQWDKYAEDAEVTVSGVLRRSQSKPDFGSDPDPRPAPGEDGLTHWNLVNLERLSEQIPYELLPVYVQEAPQPGDVQPPIPSQPELDLSEGPHFGYALQWFAFATILLIGYPVYVQRQSQHAQNSESNEEE